MARVVLAAYAAVLVWVFCPEPPARKLSEVLVAVYLAWAIAVLLLLRRRHPGTDVSIALHGVDLVWAAAVTLTAETSGRSLFFLFAYPFLAAAFRWNRAWTVATVVAAVLLLALLEFLAAPSFDSRRFLFRVVVLSLFGYLFGYLSGKEKELRAETLQAKAMERALVARELHDGAIQTMIGVEVQVDVMRRQANERSSPMVPDLERIQDLLRQEVLNLRELMQQMKPLDISPSQLPDFLAETVDRFLRDTGGIAANFVCDLHQVNLSPRVCQEVARIAQEALVNVRKHSGAHHVIVRLGRQKGSLCLVVDDDGRGFDFQGRLSHAQLDAARKGPVIIKERVRSIGGELAIESTPGVGARLEITLPESRA